MSGKQTSAAPAEQKLLPARIATVWEIYFPVRGKRARAPVFVASFPPFLYFWPTLIVCVLAAIFHGILGRESVHAGWFFVTVLTLNFVVIAGDFDQKQFIIFVLALAVLGILAWISVNYGFRLVQFIARALLSFNPMLSTDTYILLAAAMRWEEHTSELQS